MKLVKYIILFVSYLVCQGQTSNLLVVEYQQFYELNVFEKAYTMSYAELYANNNSAVYKSYKNTRPRPEPYNKDNAAPADPSVEKKFQGSYLRIDREKKEMLFYDIILKNTFLISDIYHDFEWSISDETKTIAGYPCIKATTTYRGRTWTAWYAPQIPVSFGPWKLHGLPGLILEATDSKNEITYKAVKVERQASSLLLTQDFKSLLPTKNSTPMPYERYLKERDEAFENLYRKLESQNPDATYSNVEGSVPRTGPELKYEWEK